MMTERIVAVGLLTSRELSLRPIFERAWPIDESAAVDTLLQAVDEADRRLKQERNLQDR
jgi:hypothetical protein